jgi:hypothetical protein
MKPVLALFALLAALLSSGCARDCTALVEQHCRTASLSEADCRALAERAARAPNQACEAIAQALESR